MNKHIPKLDRLMMLERKNKSPDGLGGFSENWTPLGKMWVFLKTGKGREKGGVEVSYVSTSSQIIIRAAPEGNPRRPVSGNRFSYGNRYFLIISVSEYGVSGRYLSCSVEEEKTL